MRCFTVRVIRIMRPRNSYVCVAPPHAPHHRDTVRRGTCTGGALSARRRTVLARVLEPRAEHRLLLPRRLQLLAGLGLDTGGPRLRHVGRRRGVERRFILAILVLQGFEC